MQTKTTIREAEITFKRGENQNLVSTVAQTAMLVFETPVGKGYRFCILQCSIMPRVSLDGQIDFLSFVAFQHLIYSGFKTCLEGKLTKNIVDF